MTPDWPMSSRRFAACLKPEPFLRKFVMLAGCVALLIGIALLMRLPIPPWIRAALAAIWMTGSVWEISRLSRGAGRIREIRVGIAWAAVLTNRGKVEPVRIMSGSFVLPRLAWLRLRLADGLIVGELLRGDPATAEQWRRLQILWRQGSVSFGPTAEADTISNRKTGSHC